MTYPEYPAPDSGGYGQQPGGYGQQPQPPYGQPPMGYFAPQPPKHPSATLAMVLGIISLAGIVLACGLSLPLSPFAWYFGAKAVKEIDAQPGRYSGRSEATAGMVTGIIGTVLLAFVVLSAVIVFGLIPMSIGSDSGPTQTNAPATSVRG